MNKPATKKMKYNMDRVVLNVGGTKFVVSQFTLQSSCSYFERRSSEVWVNSSNVEKEIFIDHDPEDFRCLLSFMRLGQIHAQELTSSVILLAKFLGMERLLTAIRVEAKRMAFWGDPSLVILAVSTGVLSADEEKIQKDFAELLVYDPEYVTVAEREDTAEVTLMFVIAEVLACKEVIPKKKTTFIGGLNWLHKLGYTKFEGEVSHADSIEPSIVAQLRFSRLVEEDASSHFEGLVISGHYLHIDDRREFALFNEIAYTNPGNCCVEAEFGEEKVFETDPEIISANDQCTFTTRISRLEHIDCSKGLTWLQEEGYVQREPELEKWLLKAYKNAMEEDELEPVPSMIRLWSRPKTG